MGGMKYRYLKYEAALNQYVGQCDTCKYQFSKIFSLSLANFYFYNIDDPEQRLAM